MENPGTNGIISHLEADWSHWKSGWFTATSAVIGGAPAAGTITAGGCTRIPQTSWPSTSKMRAIGERQPC
jgi:hypothetical protein